jgi:Zn-dependent peptidase ImmA (M78 family)/transcriptional regulator with XRE-family HTH domain
MTGINPVMLRVAREARGYTLTQLADLAGVTKATLARVEDGSREASGELLARLSDTLRYPEEFFAQHETVYGFEPTQLFHRKRRSVPIRTLSTIHAQANIIRWNLQRMLRRVELPDSTMPVINIEEYDGGPDDVARVVRAKWQVPEGPVRNLTEVIEAAVGIVIPFAFGTDHIDAIGMWPFGMPPLFFVDLTKPGDRLRFTLCHELGHIVMHRDYLEPDMEKQADLFAAEFLMPAHHIKHELDWPSLSSVAALKPRWKVSMAALIKRAADLGATSDRHARSLWSQMSAAGYRRREPRELDVSVETPRIYREIVDLYYRDLGRDVAALSRALRLMPEEAENLYLGRPRRLRLVS